MDNSQRDNFKKNESDLWTGSSKKSAHNALHTSNFRRMLALFSVFFQSVSYAVRNEIPVVSLDYAAGFRLDRYAKGPRTALQADPWVLSGHSLSYAGMYRTVRS